MQFNNITVSSSKDSNRVNPYNFSQVFNDFITRPKSVSLLSASIPVTYLSFQKLKTNLYINVYSSLYTIPVRNGYYDNIQEFLPVLQSATNTALGNSSFTWSYSTTQQCLKLACSGTTSFQIYGANYNENTSIAKRLGFIGNNIYNSYIEGGTSVMYASLAFFNTSARFCLLSSDRALRGFFSVLASVFIGFTDSVFNFTVSIFSIVFSVFCSVICGCSVFIYSNHR